jgi:hypothetical protein
VGFYTRIIRTRTLEFTLEYDFSICKKQRNFETQASFNPHRYTTFCRQNKKSAKRGWHEHFDCHFFDQFIPLNQYFDSEEMYFQSFNINVNDVSIKNGNLKLNF